MSEIRLFFENSTKDSRYILATAQFNTLMPAQLRQLVMVGGHHRLPERSAAGVVWIMGSPDSGKGDNLRILRGPGMGMMFMLKNPESFRYEIRDGSEILKGGYI